MRTITYPKQLIAKARRMWRNLMSVRYILKHAEYKGKKFKNTSAVFYHVNPAAKKKRLEAIKKYIKKNRSKVKKIEKRSRPKYIARLKKDPLRYKKYLHRMKLRAMKYRKKLQTDPVRYREYLIKERKRKKKNA